MKYFEEWKNSWLTLFNNLKLLIPDLILITFNILIAGLILWVSGLFPVIKTIYVDKSFDIVKNSLARIIIAGVIFVLTSFVFGSGIKAVKYSFIKDVINKKRVDLSKYAYYSKKYFLKVVFARIYIYIFGVVIAAIIGGLATFLSYKLTMNIYAIVISALGVVLVVYNLMVLFVFPIMFLKNKSAFGAVKSSFIYFKKNWMHVFFVWGVILLTNIVISSFGNLVEVPYFNSIFSVVVNLFTGVWSKIYLFRGL